MAGETILITRPAGDGETLMQELQERGFHVIHEPLTQIFLKHTAQADIEAAIADEPNAIVLTSRHGAGALATLTTLRDMPVLCSGEETARVAESMGFTRVSSAGGDVDKLLEYVAAAYDDEARFLYPSAEHVRIDLVPELATLGMQCERIVVYEAVATEQFSDVLAEQIKRGQLDAVTFLSQRASSIFQSLLAKAGLENAVESLQGFAFSEAVAEPLRDAKWKALHIAEQPTLASLVASVDNALLSKP